MNFNTVFEFAAYQVVKVNGITDPQLSVKGIGFDRTLGGLEMELRLRDYLIKVEAFLYLQFALS